MKPKRFKDRICRVCGKSYTPTCNSQKYCPGCKHAGDLARKRVYDAARRAKAKAARPTMHEAAPGCEGCWYWRFIAGATTYCCHYCLDNASSRPCKPGKDCMVRVSAKEKGATT